MRRKTKHESDVVTQHLASGLHFTSHKVVMIMPKYAGMYIYVYIMPEILRIGSWLSSRNGGTECGMQSHWHVHENIDCSWQ